MGAPDPSTAGFCGIGHLQPSRGWRLPGHAHGFHEMIVVLSGRMEVSIAGRTHRGGPGDVLWYPAGVEHREWAVGEAPLESLFLSIDWPGLNDDWPVLHRDPDGLLRQLAGWLYAARDAAGPLVRQRRAGLLVAMLATMAERVGQDPTGHSLVATVRGFVHEHLTEDLGLARLARVAGFSPYHFLRTYRRLAGLTPAAEVRAMRLERARELLLGSDLDAAAIAAATGLGDASALGKAFRRRFGTTPGNMRRRLGR